LTEIRQTIEHFLETSAEPMLLEAGEEALAISAANFVLESRNGLLSLQAWDERRNLVRRVTGVERETRGKLVLRIERFGKRSGTIELVDRRRSAGANTTLRNARLEFRQRFHHFLRRQFPAYKIAELTTESDLEHSLSPAYPRALVRQGASAWAAIGADADHPDGVLTFGLVWLDYLRHRETVLAIHGLVLYLPAGREKTTCLRLLFLNASAAQYAAFVYDENGVESRIDLGDYGNLETHLEPCRRRLPSEVDTRLHPIQRAPAVNTVERADGELSLRVHGLEFARTAGGELLSGIDQRRRTQSAKAGEIELLANELCRLRSADASDRINPLYLRSPEAWLESEVRNRIEEIDARLEPAPIYGQVPAFAAIDRGVLDLLAVENSGRLAVLELKASQDIHLPLQALDYWMRVRWHLERDEFKVNGYFPGLELRREPPRLLLISPALDFHPTSERILHYFSPDIPVERVGVGLQWRKELKVVWRS
jgi:hypothetical protein